MGKHRSTQSQIAIVIASLGLVIAFISIPWWKDWLGGIEKKPTFRFTYEGAFDQSKPEYEVAFPLGWGGDVPSTARIIISASYSGHEMQGPVYIRIQPADRNVPAVPVGEWTDFKSQSSQPKTVPLSFQNIFDYANLTSGSATPDMTSQDPWTGNQGAFEIYMEYKGEKIASQIVTFLNTPWFHQVYLSDYEFNVGHTPDAYISVVNHGASADFEVNWCLFKVSTPSFAVDFEDFSSSPDGWWPDKGLQSGCDGYQTMQISLARGEQKVILQPVSPAPITEEGVYALVTYVLKKVPVIEYDNNHQAFDARDIWLVRDGRQYVSFVVLRK